MRPVPARVLFSLLTVVALAIGALTRQLAFFAVAAIAAVFLASSLSTSRVPLTRHLRELAGHPVEIRLWGAPPEPLGSRFVLESVSLLGAGVHVFFNTTGRVMHLKVAQPSGPVLSADRVVVANAKYVQWNGS